VQEEIEGKAKPKSSSSFVVAPVLEKAFSCPPSVRWPGRVLSRLSLRKPYPEPNKIFEDEDDDEHEYEI
jgi:hypothetical protein